MLHADRKEHSYLHVVRLYQRLPCPKGGKNKKEESSMYPPSDREKDKAGQTDPNETRRPDDSTGTRPPLPDDGRLPGAGGPSDPVLPAGSTGFDEGPPVEKCEE